MDAFKSHETVALLGKAAAAMGQRAARPGDLVRSGVPTDLQHGFNRVHQPAAKERILAPCAARRVQRHARPGLQRALDRDVHPRGLRFVLDQVDIANAREPGPRQHPTQRVTKDAKAGEPLAAERMPVDGPFDARDSGWLRTQSPEAKTSAAAPSVTGAW